MEVELELFSSTIFGADDELLDFLTADEFQSSSDASSSSDCSLSPLLLPQASYCAEGGAAPAEERGHSHRPPRRRAVAAAAALPSAEEETKGDRRARILAARKIRNRQSAERSRKRRIERTELLERKVARLEVENRSLRARLSQCEAAAAAVGVALPPRGDDDDEQHTNDPAKRSPSNIFSRRVQPGIRLVLLLNVALRVVCYCCCCCCCAAAAPPGCLSSGGEMAPPSRAPSVLPPLPPQCGLARRTTARAEDTARAQGLRPRATTRALRHALLCRPTSTIGRDCAAAAA